MQPCTCCGKPYDDSFADWTICRDCKWEQMQSIDNYVYMDELGICWTQKDIDEIGGIDEINKLIRIDVE